MESVLNTIADYLVQQSFQVSLVFVLVLAGAWGLRKASAHWRYLLWLVVIGKCLTPTVLSLPLAVFPQDAELGRTEPSVTHTVAVTERSEFESAASEPNPVVTPTFGQQASVKSRGERVSSPPGANHVSRRMWLAVAWMLGVGMFLVYVSAKAWTTHQILKRTRRLADLETRNTVAVLAQSLGMRRAPGVYLAEPVAQPFVWGWFRGDIYLPLQFGGTATTEQRQAILTHELAHVARWDAAANLVQLIAQSVFFFHPLIWWANKRIREEREKCCDEIVLSGLGTCPQLYCEAIVEMLARDYEASHSTPALAITASAKTIEQRIATILTPDREFRRRPSGVAVAMLFCVAACVLPTALVVTTRADTALPADAQAVDATDAAKKAETKRWQAGQVMDFRVINAETKEPIPGVNLELQNMGEGIDFQDVKVQTTDADGRSLIKLPDLPPKAVRVYPSKPGFVPLRVYWEGEPSPVMPKSITIPMEPGKKFGGKIRNESGEPIPGVAVTVHYWGPGKRKNPHVRANVCPDNFTCKGQTTSDEKGRWHIDVMPAEIAEDRLRIYVTHPDYISDHLKRAFIPIPVTELPPIEKLFDRTAMMVMRKGEIIQGRVTDKDGQPIANAKIHDSEYYWFAPGKMRAKTGQDGDFHIAGVKPGPMKLTVQAPGYAPELIDVRRSPKPLKIQLKPGQAILGRVVDANGRPIEGVSVSARRWRGESNRLHLKAESDGDGKFRLTDAPTDAVEYDLGKKGYMIVEYFPMSPAPDDYSVTLRAPVRIIGSVVDAETGNPLDKFSLIMGTEYDDGRAPWWMRYRTNMITDGRYETTIVQEDFLYRVRVEAEGYMPAESRTFRAYDPDEGVVTYDFKLRKAAPLTGTVLGLDGEPLADAEVYLATQRMNIRNREVSDDGDSLSRKTDGAGRFEFPPEVEPFCLVAVHKQGIGMITEKEFESSPNISIRPWTEENRRLQIIRRPADGQHVDFPVTVR